VRHKIKSVSSKLEKELEGFKAEIDETLTKYSQAIKNSLKTVDETEIKSVVGAELGFRFQSDKSSSYKRPLARLRNSLRKNRTKKADIITQFSTEGWRLMLRPLLIELASMDKKLVNTCSISSMCSAAAHRQTSGVPAAACSLATADVQPQTSGARPHQLR